VHLHHISNFSNTLLPESLYTVLLLSGMLHTVASRHLQTVLQRALHATWLLHAVHVWSISGHISQAKEASNSGQTHVHTARSKLQPTTGGHLKGLGLWQRVPVRERQGNLVANQAAACIANAHTAKIRHGMLGRAAELGLYCSEGVYSAAGPCSMISSVKQLLNFVCFLCPQWGMKTGQMILYQYAAA